MVFAKSKASAEVKRKEFEQNAVKKLYLARVTGKVPKGRTVVDQPIACKSHREAIHHIVPEGKPSQTAFTCLGEDGGHSLVLCEPLTGRTHQIRLHLQWLGCSISNDPLYGPPGVGSTTTILRTEDQSGDQPIAKDDKMPPNDAHAQADPQDGSSGRKRGRSMDEGLVTEQLARQDASLNLESNNWVDPNCIFCRTALKEGCRGYYVPAKQKHDDSNTLFIWLHALRITGDSGWTYSAPFPNWAIDLVDEERLKQMVADYKPLSSEPTSTSAA